MNEVVDLRKISDNLYETVFFGVDVEFAATEQKPFEYDNQKEFMKVRQIWRPALHAIYKMRDVARLYVCPDRLEIEIHASTGSQRLTTAQICGQLYATLETNGLLRDRTISTAPPRNSAAIDLERRIARAKHSRSGPRGL